jgi:hypothetical protein
MDIRIQAFADCKLLTTGTLEGRHWTTDEVTEMAKALARFVKEDSHVCEHPL